jgi:hypothetical protein
VPSGVVIFAAIESSFFPAITVTSSLAIGADFDAPD